MRVARYALTGCERWRGSAVGTQFCKGARIRKRTTFSYRYAIEMGRARPRSCRYAVEIWFALQRLRFAFWDSAKLFPQPARASRLSPDRGAAHVTHASPAR